MGRICLGEMWVKPAVTARRVRPLNGGVHYRMRALVLLAVVSAGSWVYGARYETGHFVIETPLDARYAAFMERNVEGYYAAMAGEWFAAGWDRPLTIVYSERQADTQKLVPGEKIYYGIYMPSKDTVYTHRLMDDGGLAGWGTLFHEITHHFVATHFENAPSWFNEGLTCLLSEQSRIVDGRLCMGYPNPWREAALREMIAGGYKVDVGQIVGMSEKAFRADRNNYHPVRALFYWLYETGVLKAYMTAAKQDGYGLAVMERVCGSTRSGMNAALSAFIERNCYAGALLHEARGAQDAEAKKAPVYEAMRLMPGYRAAELEAARCLFREKDYASSAAMLAGILEEGACPEYKDALNLRGVICYVQKEFAEAAGWYAAAAEASAYSEYGYQNSFWIANCQLGRGDREKAAAWFEHFLANNWEPERTAEWVAKARVFLEKYREE